MRQTQKKTKAVPILLSAMLAFSFVGTSVGNEISKSITAYNIATAEASAQSATAIEDIVTNYEDNFTVSYNQTAPIVDDTYGANSGGYVLFGYQNRQVQLDKGKRGIKVSSIKSGSDVNGASFMLGGTMSGKFDIDFRIPSAETFDNQYWDSYNHYADVQKVIFTFTDTATGAYFDVTIDATASNAADAKKNIPEIGATYSDNTKVSRYYYIEDGVESYQSWADSDAGYNTELYGTSFANTGEVYGQGGFTAGSKSTSFSFDPTNMQLNAKRYLRNGSLGEGTYADETLYNGQVFDGRNCVLNTANSLVADMSSKVKGFENYTVKVTIAEMTPNTTLAKVRGSEDAISYDRYANMYIYSLNGQNLCTDDYNMTNGGISYNNAEFSVSLNQSAGMVNETLGEAAKGIEYAYQNRQVKQDEGKLGTLIESKASGSDVNGKSFMLSGNGTFSGKFSIDFRIPSEETFEMHWYEAPYYNPYADVQSVIFTFKDAATGDEFDVTVNASSHNNRAIKANIPEMYVSRFNNKSGQFFANHYSYGGVGDGYTVTDAESATTWTSANYNTELNGTSFANSAEVFCAGGFTESAKSTEFSFDPNGFMLNANRYLFEDMTATGKNGSNLVMSANTAVLDVDYYGEWNGWTTGALPTFENYTVKVTFAEMTDNATVANVNGVDKTYERYAKMYIYSLNGKSMVSDAFTASSIEQGELYKVEAGQDAWCVVSHGTLNLIDFDSNKMTEFGVVVKDTATGKAYKFKFDKENKHLIDNQYGMAIYGLEDGKTYEFTNYVYYEGVLLKGDTQTVTVNKTQGE